MARCLALWTWLALCSPGAHAAEVPIPDELKPWQAWVLRGEEFRRCPFFATQLPNGAADFVCAWPERLTLDVNASGGEFRQRWEVFAESWVALPGSEEHWPRTVRLDGKPAPVVARAGVPSVRLPPGNYQLSGSLQWNTRPEQLAVPLQTGIIELSVDGRPIAQPERPEGAVWLGKRRNESEPQQMNVQIYRLIRDEIPAVLTTQVRLQVSGEGREVSLGKILPDAFIPMSIDSLLPARIEPDGTLRVQVRPGAWVLNLDAHGTGVATRFVARVSQQVPEEVWSFQDNNRLRIIAVEGAELIDPVQASVPEEWRGLPTYRMIEGAQLNVIERSRGLENQDANQLELKRQLWLDFDHGGFTVVDAINGTMQQGWRLDMAAPFSVLSARIGPDNLLVTAGPEGKLSGVELRQPILNLVTAGRLEQSSGRMPATGWQTRFANVSGELNLPPGHRLLSALGDVKAPESWTGRWQLLDFFIVLIVAVTAWRLGSIAFGVLTLAALVLTHQDQPEMAWLLINLLIAVALVNVAPEGRLRAVVGWYRNLSLAAAVILFVPFAFEQVRIGLHPQLEAGFTTPATDRLVFASGRPEPMPTSPPPPPAEAAAPEVDQEQMAEQLSLRGSRSKADSYGEVAKKMVAQRYAPGTVLQSGPGVPNWSFNSYAYGWDGPVDPGEQVRFVIAGPLWMCLWRILGVLSFALVLAGIAQLAFRFAPRTRLQHWFFKTPAATVLLALFALSVLSSPAARAATPDAGILGELKARLTQPPACSPHCVETLSAEVTVSADQLSMALEIATLANVAVPVPVAAGRWEPESILVDGRSAGALYRDAAQGYWVALPAGAHTLRLAGRLAPAESIQLNFPQKPHAITTRGTGWEFAGLAQGRMLTNVLELVRQRTASANDALSAPTQFAPFVRVRRLVNLDLDWQVTTVVERLAPEKGAFALEVPLLKDESVLTPGIVPRARGDVQVVDIGLAAQESATRWTSSLPRGETLQLAMTASPNRTEVWSFTVSPIWNVRFRGVPQVAPESVGADQPWTFDYFPRAAEVLQLEIARPAAVSGSALALDRVELAADVGSRSTTASLELRYRSTQGNRQTIVLPQDAQVLGVTSDGVSVPVRPQNGELSLALLPGAHTINVRWQSDTGTGWRTRTPSVDLRTSASNVTTRLAVGGDRWVLFATGKGVGPAILYWGELAVFIVLAVVLGRIGKLPLRTHDWLLLGLGLSTFSWGVLLLFAGWIFAMRWRAGLQHELSAVRFNLLQLALALLGVLALGALLSAIPAGLLGTPDMSVQPFGAGYRWFIDQAAGPVPPATLYSVPLFVYKAAILLWALWLSFALLKWLPWAWRAYTERGMWRGAVQLDAQG
jgi:hypothetical protein